MSYAVVMAYVDANGMPEQRVRLAASLAEKFNATLIGLSALAVHPPFLIEGVAIQQATAADIVEISLLRSVGGYPRLRRHFPGNADHLRGIDNPGFDQIDVFLAASIASRARWASITPLCQSRSSVPAVAVVDLRAASLVPATVERDPAAVGVHA
jgi:hypothetical protein